MEGWQPMRWTGKRIGRARVGRGRMKWRGKVVLSFGGGFIGLAVAAWEARHSIEHLACMLC
uniref:Uncharacterized protein n=1 Tax=Oryza punctata TaxID=4537 RepID=A0A0E0KSV9_ORYPU